MKTAVITGAACGIGRACALEFAKAGYFTVINYRSSKEDAIALEEKIKSFSGNCMLIQADVSKKSEVERLFSEIRNKNLKVDVLVNNAGISSVKLICDTEEKDYENIFDINMKSVYLCTKEASYDMVSKKWGRIINISSVWGVCGASCEGVYSASKAAVNGFTKAIAKEFALSGICVNAIAPGVIDTKMNDCFSQDEKEELKNGIPAGRFGDPKEVAKLALFLASEDAGYITGQVIGIDGGFCV